MGRKKEDRQAKADHKKNRRLAKEAAENGEDDSISLAHQLAPLGLQVREIPGDGNCLFRAVSDQLEGNSRNHLEYRVNTVTYMEHFREDFEPFVEDDVPFDRHAANLRKSGTFAGNDALVALARYLKVSIVIHQAGQPVWQINGCSDESVKPRQIHLSYHNGEHYNSVRRVGDHSNSPSTIVCSKTVPSRPEKDSSKENKSKKSDDQVSELTGQQSKNDARAVADLDSCPALPLCDEEDVLINFVACETGLTDRSQIQRMLSENNYDAAEVIEICNGGACRGENGKGEEKEGEDDDDNGMEKGSRDDADSGIEKGSKDDADGDLEKGSRDDTKENETLRPSSAAPATKPKLSRPEVARSKVKSTKDKRKEKREIKKARQAERNRRKLVGDDANEEDDVHVLTNEIQCLDL